MKKPEDAIEIRKYLMDKFPDSNYAYQAREKLKKIEKGSQWAFRNCKILDGAFSTK